MTFLVCPADMIHAYWLSPPLAWLSDAYTPPPPGPLCSADEVMNQMSFPSPLCCTDVFLGSPRKLFIEFPLRLVLSKPRLRPDDLSVTLLLPVMGVSEGRRAWKQQPPPPPVPVPAVSAHLTRCSEVTCGAPDPVRVSRSAAANPRDHRRSGPVASCHPADRRQLELEDTRDHLPGPTPHRPGRGAPPPPPPPLHAARPVDTGQRGRQHRRQSRVTGRLTVRGAAD